MKSRTPASEPTTLKWVEVGRPHSRSRSYPCDWRSVSKPRRGPTPCTNIRRRRLAVVPRCLLRRRTTAAVRGVGEGLLAGRAQPLVELLELLAGEVDLAADLHQLGDLVARQPVGDVGDRPHVGRDVLAGAAVTAGGGAGEPALLVREVDREAVDLQLAQEVVRRAGVVR